MSFTSSTAASDSPDSVAAPHSPVEFTCLKCGHRNPADRRFCGRCGADQWQSCPECDGQTRAGEKFCGHCGADVAEVLNQQQIALESKLADAERLRAEHEYDCALVLLRTVAGTEDPRLRELAERACGQIQELQQEQQAKRKETAAAIAAAEQLRERGWKEDAVALLEQVPKPLQTAALGHLRDRIQAELDEQADLEKRLHDAVQAGKICEVASLCDRLLTLESNHEEARKLARQVRDRTCRRAKANLAEHAYEQARELLDCVPLVHRGDQEVQRLKDLVTELAWLQRQLKTAPYADETLLAIAARLIKLDPKNGQAKKLAKTLQVRLAPPPASDAPRLVPWAKPKRKVSGLQADWLFDSHRFNVTDSAQQAWNEWPDSFFIACGLALQGLGLADVDSSFVSDRPASPLRRFSLRRKKPATSTAWGLDFGSDSMKYVQLTTDPNGGVRVQRAGRITRPQEERFDAERDGNAWPRDALNAFREQHAVIDGAICVSVPLFSVLTRYAELPRGESKRLEEAVAFEAKRQMPVSMDKLVWYFHANRIGADRGGAKCQRVLIQAIRRIHFDRLVRLFDDAGMTVAVMQSAGAALHNFAAFEFHGETRKPNQAIAVLDIGAVGSELVISSPQSVWMRNLPVGGRDFTKAVMQPFRLTQERAERLKRRPTSARQISLVYQELDPCFARLLHEIRRSLDAHAKRFPDLPVTQLYGLGGGMRLFGTLARLQAEL